MAYIIEWLPGILVIWFWWRDRRKDAQIQELQAIMLQLQTTKNLYEFDVVLALANRCIGEDGI